MGPSEGTAHGLKEPALKWGHLGEFRVTKPLSFARGQRDNRVFDERERRPWLGCGCR